MNHDAIACRQPLPVDSNAIGPHCDAGDIQLLNNHTVLHARAAFEDDAQNKRDLLRAWLNLRGRGPLVPALVDRLNTGPGGGVAARGVDD